VLELIDAFSSYWVSWTGNDFLSCFILRGVISKSTCPGDYLIDIRSRRLSAYKTLIENGGYVTEQLT
jgi:hypothetical protein